MENIFLASAQGQQQGPYTDEQVRQLWMNGQLPSETRFWTQGMAEWRPLLEMPGIAPLPQLGRPYVTSVYAQMGGSRHAFLFDPAPGTRFTTRMLWAYLVFSALGAVGSLWSLATPPAPADQMNAVDWFEAAVAIPAFLVSVFTMVAFGRWIYRAGVNVRGFGAEGMENSPGWAVGWYFVPIANLWKPFQAMREIWQASRDPQNWRQVPSPSMLGWWWGFWLITNQLEQVVFRASLREDALYSERMVDSVSLAAGLLDIPLCLIAMKMINTIHDMQQEWVRKGE